MYSPDAFSKAKFLARAKLFCQSKSKTKLVYFFAISFVLSFEPVSTITISSTEQGNLFGSKTTSYVVNYMNLQSADIKVQQTSYNTEEQKPTFSITYKKHSLPENILDNFEITYQNNILPTTQALLPIHTLSPITGFPRLFPLNSIPIVTP